MKLKIDLGKLGVETVSCDTELAPLIKEAINRGIKTMAVYKMDDTLVKIWDLKDKKILELL